MADLIEIKVSASFDEASISKMQKDLSTLGEKSKTKVDVDSKDAQKQIKEVESSLKRLSDKPPKISLIDEKTMRDAGVQFKEFEGSAKDAQKSIMKGYEELDGVVKGSTKSQAESFNSVTGELEKFTVSIEKTGGVTEKYTHQLVQLEDGTERWIRTSIKGAEDLEKGFKKTEQQISKLLTLQKQLAALEYKAEGLDKQSDEYKKIMKDVEALKAKSEEYMNDLSKMSDADFSKLQNEYKQVANATDEATKSAKKLADQEKEAKKLAEATRKEREVTYDQLGGAMETTGRSMVRLAAPVVALGGAAIKMQMDYESAFAGVRKTVDATEEEFAKLSDGIRDLGKTFPQTATEIAEIAEVAGQLGVKQEDILDFTEVMIKLGDSTNMTSAHAADLLARFTNITGMDIKDVDRLGAVVVELGNNFATSETEIVDMSTRLAAAGSQVGLSEAEIMGLSASLSSLGLRAQLGGTAFSKIMINMANASTIGVGKMKELEKQTGKSRRELELMSSNDKGGYQQLAQSIGMTTKEMDNFIKQGKDLEGFGKIAGISGEEFAKAFEEDAIGAIATFIEGLANAEEGGESALELLDELGIKEVRLRDTLLRAGGAHELFNEGIEMGNRAWEENIALNEEAEERYKTNASKLKVLKSRIMEAGIELGGQLAPALMDVLDGVVSVVEGFAKLPSGIQVGIVKAAAFVAVAGTIMTIGGRFLKGMGGISKSFGIFGKLLGGTGDLVKTTGGEVGILAKLMGKLGTSGGLLGVAVVGAVGAVAWGVSQHMKKVKEEKEELDRLIDNTPEIMEGHIQDIETLKSLQDEFNRLNPLVGDNGDLSRMSGDQQERYLDIVKKMSDISPEMETFYNSQGDLIAGTREEIERLIAAKEEEMKIDAEKLNQGFDKRMTKHSEDLAKSKEKIIDHNKAQAKAEKELAQGFWITTQGTKQMIETDEEREKWQKKINKHKEKSQELSKKESEAIQETMRFVKAQADLMGIEYDKLRPHMEGFTTNMQKMLEVDPTNTEGVAGALQVLERMGKEMETLGEKSKFLQPEDIVGYTTELTKLGMGYGDATKQLFGMMTETKSGSDKFSLMNKVMAEGGEISEATSNEIKENYKRVEGAIEGNITKVDFALIEAIGKTDIWSAAYLASMMELEGGLADFIESNEQQLRDLDLSDVADPTKFIANMEIAKQTSKTALEMIDEDAKEQIKATRYLQEELGVISKEEADKRVGEINTNRAQYKKDIVEQLEFQQSAIIEEGRIIREGVTEAQNLLKEKTSSMEDIWKTFDTPTREFLLDYTDIDDAKDGWLELMEEWLTNNPESKEFTAMGTGMEYVLDNIKDLGDGWDELNPEQVEFVTKALGIGLEEADEWQEKWDNLYPEQKQFIAQAVGIEDVDKANDDTMSKWAEDPAIKMFLATNGGLDTVRYERDKTDKKWDIKIGEKTYKTNEQGAKAARSEFVETKKLWDRIPNSQTKKFITEKITRVKSFFFGSEPAKRWTGDKNFKGGLSYVGEKGRELLVYPDGSHDMTGETTELRNLPKGTRIYNNKDTEGIMTGKKIPGFAKGTTKAEDYRATYDRYTGIDINLQRQNTLLAKNNELQAQAVSNLMAKTQLIKHEIQLEKEHEKILKSKQSEARVERAELEKKLRREGFKFTGTGDGRNITNLKKVEGKSQEVEDLFKRYNELQFNLIPSLEVDRMAINTKIQAALSKGFEQQKRINNAMSENNHLLEVNRIMQGRATNDIDKRINLMKTEQKLLQEQAKLKRGEADLLRNERNQLELLLKREGLRFAGGGDSKIVTNPEKIKGMVLEVEEALDRFHQIQFELLPSFVVDGMQLQDAIDAIKKDIANDIIDSQFKGDDRGISDLQRNTERLKNLRTAIQVEDGSGRDKQLLDRIIQQEVERSKKAYDLSWKYIQQLKSHEEGSDEWYKLRDKADDYMEMSEQIDRELSTLRAERLAVELKAIDTVLEAEKKKQEELTYQMNMLDDEDEATNKRRVDLSQKLLESEIEYNKVLGKNVKDLKEQLKNTLYNTDEWHALNDAVELYEKSLKDSNLEIKKMNKDLVEAGREMARINHENKLEVAEKYFFEGKTEQEARKALDDKIKAQQEFIDGEEKLLEIERLIKFIDDEGLTITQEQNSLLEQGDKLERAKLDRLEKELSIQQEQIKLSNLEKQKTIRQLKKNADGSFGFEYVADQKAIRDTQDDILKAKKDLIDWERGYANEQDEKAFKEKQDRLKEEEERLEDSLEKQLIAIKEFYDGILEMNQSLNKEMNGNIALEMWGKQLGEMSPALDELGVSVGEMMQDLGKDAELYLNILFNRLGVGSKNDLFDKDFDLNKYLRKMDVVAKDSVGNKTGLTAKQEQDYLRILAKANTFNLKDTEKMLKEQQMFNSRGSQAEDMNTILQRTYAQAFNAVSNAAMGTTRGIVGMPTSGIATPRLPMAPAIGKGVSSTAQNFNISKLEFPNVRDARDIEKAITNLPTFATQWANKK